MGQRPAEGAALARSSRRGWMTVEGEEYMRLIDVILMLKTIVDIALFLPKSVCFFIVFLCVCRGHVWSGMVARAVRDLFGETSHQVQMKEGKALDTWWQSWLWTKLNRRRGAAHFCVHL